jgi:WD repeat-containing protein 89
MTDKNVLSGSSDGLISLSNPEEEDDDDEVVLHVANWGCSVSQAGWTTGEGGTTI